MFKKMKILAEMINNGRHFANVNDHRHDYSIKGIRCIGNAEQRSLWIIAAISRYVQPLSSETHPDIWRFRGNNHLM